MLPIWRTSSSRAASTATSAERERTSARAWASAWAILSSTALVRRVIIASLGVLLAKTLALAGETHLAMISRGYAGEVRVIDDLRFRARDIAAIAGAAAILIGLLWVRQ